MRGSFFGGFQPTEEYNMAAFTHSACVPEFNPRNNFMSTYFDFADVKKKSIIMLLFFPITRSYVKLILYITLQTNVFAYHVKGEIHSDYKECVFILIGTQCWKQIFTCPVQKRG